ncbi:unnamed protein product, partial [Rotaria sp. Silwood1]
QQQQQQQQRQQQQQQQRQQLQQQQQQQRQQQQRRQRQGQQQLRQQRQLVQHQQQRQQQRRQQHQQQQQQQRQQQRRQQQQQQQQLLQLVQHQQQRQQQHQQQRPRQPQQQAVSTFFTTTTTTAQSIASAFWSFDSNALELYNSGLDGTLSGSPTYATSFAGYGAAISLTRSSTQYAYITPKVLPFNSRSFTIEAWIYPSGFSSSNDYGIFGQCQATSTNLCLHLIVRNNQLFCGFYNNNIQGATTLTMSTWYHVACVYDSTAMTKQVWLDGNLDGTHSASAYNGLWGNTTIGATFQLGSVSAFNGYIDNVRFEARTKNSTEILNDATLHVYYSFDSGSLTDNGPNGINATAYGTLSTITGRVNQALQFNSGPYISYSYTPFYFLGISGNPFTIALWAKPTGSYAQQTILLVEQPSGWCVHYLVMTSSGQLVANCWIGSNIATNGPILSLNTWTHIAYTYSTTHGIRLYINGNQYSTTGGFTFSGSGVPMRFVLGGDSGRTYCSPAYGGVFTGALDEFYLYRRELTAAQVLALANP